MPDPWPSFCPLHADSTKCFCDAVFCFRSFGWQSLAAGFLGPKAAFHADIPYSMRPGLAGCLLSLERSGDFPPSPTQICHSFSISVQMIRRTPCDLEADFSLRRAVFGKGILLHKMIRWPRLPVHIRRGDKELAKNTREYPPHLGVDIY